MLQALHSHLASGSEVNIRRQSRAQSRSDRRRESAVRAQLEASYHQVRVLLLVAAFTSNGAALDGLTKLAKLDFLLRYPQFLERLARGGSVPGLELPEGLGPTQDESRAVESRMVRYKYGPWDDRYYGIVGALVGRGLVEYVPNKQRLALRVTPGGNAMAKSISLDPAWSLTARRCEVLHAAFARTSGNRLKDLIYSQLPDVVDRPHRSVI
jgi:hypothetical protein